MLAVSYRKHLKCKRWHKSKFVWKALVITLIRSITPTITKISIDKGRINYCWIKLFLFLAVRSEDHWSRSPCTRKSCWISVPAGEKCSPELVDSSSCLLKCSFSQKFTVFTEKTYRPSGLPKKVGNFRMKLWCCVDGEYYNIIWFYQLGWTCELATDSEADVSSVSPSSEELWPDCV